ncbi:hypothetical protein MLGJGCBP_02163 [Rhodococcus sp. T7]|nr:hypothetical protein MLGJGCBP_02163 [Rhodococcus sp. T7]
MRRAEGLNIENLESLDPSGAQGECLPVERIRLEDQERVEQRAQPELLLDISKTDVMVVE